MRAVCVNVDFGISGVVLVEALNDKAEAHALLEKHLSVSNPFQRTRILADLQQRAGEPDAARATLDAAELVPTFNAPPDWFVNLSEDPEVEVTTCKVVAKSGYKIGDRVVRAAQVLVVDPADG